MTGVIEDLLATVERLRPTIEANRDRAEAERRLPAEVHQAMFDAGLFGMLVPRKYGGLEVHPIEAMRVWEAVARIDSAAAWNLVMNQAAGCFAAWLPEKGATDLFGDGPTTVAGALFPPGAAHRHDGGWRVTARTPFASGCDNTNWFVVPALEMDGAEPRLDPETGLPIMLVAFVRRDDGRIHDTWNTVGMRGTGSSDVEVTDVYVPDWRVVPLAPLANPAPGYEGPVYRVFPWTAIFGEATVSVGVAAAAVDEVIELAANKTPAYNVVPLREQQWAQHAIGRARGRVDAARATLHRAAEQAYDEVAITGSSLSWEAKIRLQLAACFAAEAAAEAVRMAAEVAGSSAIRVGHRFERHFRDVHVLTQHTSKSSPRYASAGRLLFGLENDWAWLGL
jgi:alkylation response protein AidB-like acyl-CoA dehydrogenase